MSYLHEIFKFPHFVNSIHTTPANSKLLLSCSTQRGGTAFAVALEFFAQFRVDSAQLSSTGPRAGVLLSSYTVEVVTGGGDRNRTDE